MAVGVGSPVDHSVASASLVAGSADQSVCRGERARHGDVVSPIASAPPVRWAGHRVGHLGWRVYATV